MTFADVTTLAKSLYRDEESAILLGVCAGLAERFDFSVAAARILALLALLFFTLPAGFVYLTGGVLLPLKSLHFHGGGAEKQFWQTNSGNHNALG